MCLVASLDLSSLDLPDLAAGGLGAEPHHRFPLYRLRSESSRLHTAVIRDSLRIAANLLARADS